MRRLLIILLIAAGAISYAQAQNNEQPPYKRFPTVPPFKLTMPDSSLFARNNLVKNKKAIIMYFSPSCDHCQHQTEDMLKRIQDFKEISIIMATFQPFEEVVDFYKKYKLADYANIKIGRETTYFLPPFYQIGSLPFLALYDEKGNLITAFEGNASVDKLMEAFDKK